MHPQNQDNDTAPPGLDELNAVAFPPRDDDSAFLASVNRRVRVRRRRRAVATTGISTLGAVLLLVAVLNGGLFSRSGINLDILRQGEFAQSTTITSESELDAELQQLFSDIDGGDASDGTEVSDDLAALFTLGDASDPVTVLAGYDSEVQEELLNQLMEFDILTSSSRSGTMERGES